MQLTNTEVPEDYFEVKTVDRSLSYFLIKSSYLVCDVGGADGIDAFNMAKLASLCISLDIDKEGIERGLARSKQLSLSTLEFIRGDCQHLPIRDDSIDLLTCFSTLDHLPGGKSAVELAIKEFSRALKKSGYATITLPNRIFLPGALSMRIRLLTGEDLFFEQRYSPKELTAILQSSNLEPISFDSRYPTKIGATILRNNLPGFVAAIPGYWALLLVAERIFVALQRLSFLRLFGARFGYLSKKTSP